jgi:DNA invertase Pin-like site-specific DNA recombinase
MAVLGYARVSSEGQSLETQLEQLKQADADKIYSEKISGAKANNRKELARALKGLGPGDVLLVTRLDRLARSTLDLLTILDGIAKAGAGFKSLADTWADTTTAHGRLILTVLGGLAEFERELIKARTTEGRKRARARGVHLGRPSALNRDQQREALVRIAAGEAYSDIARTFGVSHTTISRLAAK